MRNPLRYRDPDLVAAILDAIYEHATDSTPQPLGWSDVVNAFTSHAHHWRTVENVMYDLVAFGAAHRIGAPARGRRPDTRALMPTPLGQAWLEQHVLPLPERTP